MNILILSFLLLFSFCKKERILALPNKAEISYTIASEDSKHLGTWLFWPHQYQFGIRYRNRLDTTWVAMTKALIKSEKVQIVCYNENEKNRIIDLLKTAKAAFDSVVFIIAKTDDEWARDSGPIYAKDSSGQLVIEDWGFNGWGNKYKFENSNLIPTKIASEQNIPVVNLNSEMILEGGAVEIDGKGTLLATKSAVLNTNRNKIMTQSRAEALLTKYYGISHFIWLEGTPGVDITDMHIDGFAKFVNHNTLVTMDKIDLQYWMLSNSDITKLYAAKNKNGNNYNLVKLPLTQNSVTTTYGKNLGYKGSYINFYIANKIVLVPNYNDANDDIANKIIQSLFPNREVIGIDVRNLYANGGMIHCVTQQQPQ